MVLVNPDSLFERLPNFSVFKNHRWVARDLPGEPISIACSKDDIELVRYIIRPIYDIQFHPEIFSDVFCGDEIFRNFFIISGGYPSGGLLIRF